jgi:hypothetical protein
MKRLILIGVSIISVFIICTLSYQPIIANEPIINKSTTDKKSIQFNIIKNQELYQKYIKRIYRKDDCDCNEPNKQYFHPIICAILIPIYFFLLMASFNFLYYHPILAKVCITIEELVRYFC